MSEAASFIAAIRSGDLGAVEAALEANPDLAGCRDESGVSVVCLAVYSGREDVAYLLARRRQDLDIFEASTLGATPLHEAAFCGHADLVRLLLHHDANPDVRDSDGKRPIDLAREHGHDEIVALLASRTEGHIRLLSSEERAWPAGCRITSKIAN